MPASKAMRNNLDKSDTSEKKIEYSVYIHLPANQNNHFWEKTSTTEDAELALEQATMLYESQKYPRVEVIRKFFCEKRKKRISEAVKVFETTSEAFSARKLMDDLWEFLSGTKYPAV